MIRPKTVSYSVLRRTITQLTYSGLRKIDYASGRADASKDIAQYRRYKEVLGDSVGTLAKFGQTKYNDSNKWEQLQRRVSVYREINSKTWSEEFKSKSKQAYDRVCEREYYNVCTCT